MKKKKKMGKHLDITTDFAVTQDQKDRLTELANHDDFKTDVSFYLNGDYIGGRPNDRG